MAIEFGSSSSTISPYLQSQYGQQYNNALNFNTQNYGNILSQYGANQSQISQGAEQVAQGYGALSGDVQKTIQGIGASQGQAIKDYYASQGGALNQSLVSRGLGNTTVAGQMQRGVSLDFNKANIALANQMAQLSAGYQSSLGSAGLQARMQGIGLNAQAGNVLGGNLAHSQFPFPQWPPNSSQSRQQSSGGLGGGFGGRGGGMRGDGTSGDWWAGQGGGYGGMSTGQMGGDSTGLRGAGGPWNAPVASPYQPSFDAGAYNEGADGGGEDAYQPEQSPEDIYSGGGDYPWDE